MTKQLLEKYGYINEDMTSNTIAGRIFNKHKSAIDAAESLTIRSLRDAISKSNDIEELTDIDAIIYELVARNMIQNKSSFDKLSAELDKKIRKLNP